MTDEIWKLIHDFPKYQVSDHGRVRNIRTDRILRATTYYHTPPRITLHHKETLGKENYRRVDVYIHRLVAEHFLSDYDDERVVEFIDGNTQNCRASNLTVGKRKARGATRD